MSDAGMPGFGQIGGTFNFEPIARGGNESALGRHRHEN